MRYLKLFSAVLVVCALGAVMVASAVALPTILPNTITTYTGKSVGGTTLKIVGGFGSVVCGSAKGEGTVEANGHLGLFHISFEGCKETLNGACTGLGETSGVILSLGSWHLVFDTLGATLGAAGLADLFLTETTHFECAGVRKLFIVPGGGNVLCLIKNPTALTKVFEFGCKERSSGGPESTKYYNEGGTLVSIKPLLTSEAEGTAKESIQVGTGTVETAAPALLMV